MNYNYINRIGAVRYAFILILAIVVWASSNVNWGKNRWPRIIKCDGNGYYAYLPAIFIYHDLHFGFFDSIASRPGFGNMTYDYRNVSWDGGVVDQYYAGTALAQLPFFAIANVLCMMTGQPVDGYQFWNFVMINVASIFYLLLALIFLNKLLHAYNISSKNRALTLLLTVFGTNVFYYAVFEPSMSHIYSFAFITGFLFFIHSYFQKPDIRHLTVAALFWGILSLIRPLNVIIILTLPFLAGDLKTFLTAFRLRKSELGWILTAFFCFFIIVAIQPVIYKIQTDHFLVYSYGSAGFDFLHPHFIDILFSYRKGLFVYTPLWLISLGGLIYIFRKSKFQAISLLVFFIILTWLLSSWKVWYYGGSFSSRVFLDYFALFAILLATILNQLKPGVLRFVLYCLLVFLVFLCLVQTFQYYFAHIHWCDMNKEKYWNVFLDLKRLIYGSVH